MPKIGGFAGKIFPPVFEKFPRDFFAFPRDFRKFPRESEFFTRRYLTLVDNGKINSIFLGKDIVKSRPWSHDSWEKAGCLLSLPQKKILTFSKSIQFINFLRNRLRMPPGTFLPNYEKNL